MAKGKWKYLESVIVVVCAIVDVFVDVEIPVEVMGISWKVVCWRKDEQKFVGV